MDIVKGKLTTAKKIVIYGPEGIGKSTMASKFDTPLFFDVENGTAALDVDRAPGASSWTMFCSLIKQLLTDTMHYQTVVIDTADWAEELCSAHVAAKAGHTGIEDFGYGKGYTYVVEEWCKMLDMLQLFVNRGIHVVILAHAHMRKVELPEEAGAFDRWEMKLNKKVAAKTKEWADMVLFANFKTLVVADEKTKTKKAQGQGRVMYTTHHACWDAKNRDGLDGELPFDYASIAHCIPLFEVPEAQARPTANVASMKSAAPAETAATQVPAEDVERSKRIEEEAEWERAEAKLLKLVRPETMEKAKAWLAKSPTIEQIEAKIADLKAKEAEIANQANDATSAALVASTANVASNGAPIDPTGFPTKLFDLMTLSGVSEEELQTVVAARGHYPIETPVSVYTAEYIEGRLVAHWDKVVASIEANREQKGA